MNRNVIVQNAKRLFALAEKHKNESSHSISFDDYIKCVLLEFEQYQQSLVKEQVAYKKIINAKYAIAAYIDEIVLQSKWEHQLKWKNQPLQVMLFNEYLAGEGFYQRLDDMCAYDSVTVDVIELYYLCLKLGFKGKYAIQGDHERDKLIEELYQIINDYRGQISSGQCFTDEQIQMKPANRLLSPKKVAMFSMLLWAVVYMSFYGSAYSHYAKTKTKLIRYSKVLKTALEKNKY